MKAEPFPCTCKRTATVMNLAGCPVHDECMCHLLDDVPGTQMKRSDKCARCRTVERLRREATALN